MAEEGPGSQTSSCCSWAMIPRARKGSCSRKLLAVVEDWEEGTNTPARMMAGCCTWSKWAWGEDCSCQYAEASWALMPWGGS